MAKHSPQAPQKKAPPTNKQSQGDLKKERVIVFGGSGFIGRYVVQQLAEMGCRIRVAVRHPERAYFLKPGGRVGQIETVAVNLCSPSSVAAAIEGCQTVVNLVGILYETRRQGFQDIHVKGANDVADAAKKAGVNKLIHMSALGASESSDSVYAQTKAAGERAVLTHFPKAVIFRPSVVFGPEDNFFNQFASMTTLSPFLPLIGGGNTRLQPVYVADVARAIVLAASSEASDGIIYELGGDEIKTLRDCLEMMLHIINRSRYLMPVPFSCAYPLAYVLQMFPHPRLTVDQVRLLKQDNIVSKAAQAENRTLHGLGITPQTLSMILPTYLKRYCPQGKCQDITV